MENNINEIKGDVKEIRKDVGNLVVAVNLNTMRLKHYNELLQDHIKRTNLLEERTDRIEIPYKIISFVGIPLATIASILTIIHYFVK